MSIQLLTALTESVTHIVQGAAILPMADDDLIGFAGQKVTAFGLLCRSASIVAAIIFVIKAAIRSNGAMTTTIISGLSAALFVYIIFHVTELSDRVDNEMSSAPVPTITTGGGTSAGTDVAVRSGTVIEVVPQGIAAPPPPVV